MTSATPRRRRKPAATAALPRRAPKLNYILNTEASERFLALPLAERRRRLEAFRKTFAPAFKSVDEYLAEKRRENARGDH